MDHLEAHNYYVQVAADLEKSQKLNELLLKYKHYFEEYLKVCKCKQTVDLSAIRAKTEDLEEEFAQLNGVKYVVKEIVVPNGEEDNDTTCDATEEESPSSDSTKEVIVSTLTNEFFVCQQIGCNQKFDSKVGLELHSQLCGLKRVDIQQNQTIEKYICPECQTPFDDSFKLKCHQTMHRRTAAYYRSGGDKQFVCQESGCSKKFDRESSLNVHMSRQHRPKGAVDPINKPFVCDWIGCEHRTANRQDMDLHVKRRHTLEKPFKCDKCDKSYELEKILRSHQKIHSNFRLKCEYEGCLYKTPNMWELKTHIKNKHLNEERFVCDFEGCGRNYKYEGDLKVHKRQHNNKKMHTCEWPGCEAGFARSETLRNHILRHKNERQFKCDFDGCGKDFNTKKALNTHRTLHAGTMYRFPCEWPGCSRMLPSRAHIKVHMDSFHLKIRAYDCDECDKSFTLKETLKSHKMCCHTIPGLKRDKKQFKCDECLRCFNGKKNLENHKNSVHSDEPLFMCDWPECEERFKTSYSLTAHRAIHANGGQFKCCAINCGKSFMNRETLLSHELIHNKKFACSWPECGKKFAKNFLLTHHIKRHQNIREYKCEVEGCGQSFVTKTHLNHHLDKHSNPLPYKCLIDECDRAFSRKSSLQNHMEKVHHVQS